MNRIQIFHDARANWRHHLPLMIFVYLFYLFLFPQTAAAASLFLFPPSGTYEVGANFNVSLRVNSGDGSINASEGSLIFNPAEVKVQSISKNGSVFNLWTTEPVFSNTAGTITFGGGTTTGYNGSGTVLTVTFISKAAAVSQMSFSSGSVLAADGKGSNILSNMNGGIYTFQSAVVIPAPQKTPGSVEQPGSLGTPYAPVVTSTTHPDPESWYANNNPELAWEIPDGITAIRTRIDQKPYLTPDKNYLADASSVTIKGLDDGIWYFHIQFKNSVGWGAILHRKIMIDTKPPLSFAVAVDNGGDATNPSPKLIFKTKDELSGIVGYEIKIDQGGADKLAAEAVAGGQYGVSALAPGRHTAIVKARDRANNYTLEMADVDIKSLNCPIITGFPASLAEGDSLSLYGTSDYPGAELTMFVKNGGGDAHSQEVKVGADGTWSVQYLDKLSRGNYQIWAHLVDNRGAQTGECGKITLAVSIPFIAKIGEMIINYTSIIIILAILLLLMVLLFGYVWHRLGLWRKKLQKETNEADKMTEDAFKLMHEQIQEEIKNLDNVDGMTDRENEIRNRLQSSLDSAEKLISKEIDDIKKEV